MVRQFQFRDLLEKVVGTFNQVSDVAAGQHLPLTLMGLQWKANRGTAFPSGCDIQRAWVVMDATGIPVGRLASEIAMRLQGKNNPFYTPFMDTGDFVIVINAERAIFTGKKPTQKTYFRHTGRPGGARHTSFQEMLERKPTFAIEHAVKGMLPKTKLGEKMARKLKVYAGADHPHAAQQPVTVFPKGENLRDISIFRKRLAREHNQWLVELPPEEREKDILLWGGEAYSPKRIKAEFDSDSAFASEYTKMMYDSHFQTS